MKLRPFILYIRSFGIKVFLSKLVRKFFWKSSSRFGRWINQKNETIITEFLMRNIVREMNIPQILGTANTESVGIPRIIWVMWWQGIGQAPDLVKKCVSQIYKYNENCEIRLIDHINYGDYVDISKEILEGIHEGRISFTHFSDIIRCQILSHYGGVWADATLLVKEPLDEKIYDSHFYSIKTGNYTNDPSHGRWTTFFMCSKPNSQLFLFAETFWTHYFRKYDLVIDYILLDYILKLAYELLPEVREHIDAVPINNSLCFQL